MEVATAAPHRNPKAKVFLNGVAGAFARLGYNLIAVLFGTGVHYYITEFRSCRKQAGIATRKVSKW